MSHDINTRQAGVQILASLDAERTPRDPFRDVEARKHFRKSMFYLGFVLVDLVRFELTTSSMPWKRAPNCATGPRMIVLSIYHTLPADFCLRPR